jgi:hypothetical protein
VLVSKPLPFALPGLKIDMLWHERDARDPALKWVRSTLQAVTAPDARLTSEQGGEPEQQPEAERTTADAGTP